MKNTVRQLVSSDLDMTFLDHATYATPDNTLEALKWLREQGLVVALVTGWDTDNHYSGELRDMVGADVVIYMNGTKITVEDKLIYEHHMGRKLLERILDFIKIQGYSVGVTTGGEDFYTYSEQVVARDIRCWGECGRQFKGPTKLLDIGMRTLAYVGAPGGAHRTEEAFPELKFLLFVGFQGADVVKKTVSKAQGLFRFCDYYGIDAKGTYALDDSMNDYETVQTAGAGIAIGDVLDVLKEAADYVTTDIREDGVYRTCVHFGLI